ncbi:uncharacterized protein SAPINGB_P004465 [Magnusiomyces paraingens]|uniref:Uncharacterized protein n=1 Tax=Magnusiomyces paraingens TaxID=2606893 RepID=A0A5E8BUL1_9ASCO|nr:uncharacterized protein SAPINGB_P004465 [Saprochaete ingens]VVT55176.1 unnamed protein product [Saprochaete ingens]
MTDPVLDVSGKRRNPESADDQGKTEENVPSTPTKHRRKLSTNTMSEIVAVAPGSAFHKRLANFETQTLSGGSSTIGTGQNAFMNSEFPLLHPPPAQSLDSANDAIEYAISISKSPTKKLLNDKYNFDVLSRASPRKQKQIRTSFQNRLHTHHPKYFTELSKQASALVLDRLASSILPVPIVGMDTEYSTLYTLLQRTVAEGEGNSCVILGPRSTGKTLMVDTALRTLEKQYPSDFMVVRISGFAVTDDKMAIRELCRQIDSYLQRGPYKKQVNYETIEKKSISECLTSLLTLLYSDDDYDENKANREKPISVIIILEEVDRFATHSKQTLLYNLLDMAQSSKTPIAVVGVTPRINTRELFEKRVRSRFSQRIITTKRTKDINEFWNIASAGLRLYPTEFSPDTLSHNPQYQRYLSGQIPETAAHYTEFMEAWNNSLDTFYKDKSSNLYKILELVFFTTKDVRQFYDRMIYPLTLTDPLLSDLDIGLLEREQGGLADTQSFVEGLSELELSLLICAARVEIKYGSDTFNFNVVYDEYVQMATQLHKERRAALSRPTAGGDSRGGYRVWSREVARAAWERLEAMELVTYIEAGSNGTGMVFIAAEGGGGGGGGGGDEGGGSGSHGGGSSSNNNSNSNGGGGSVELTAVQAKPAVGSTKGAIVGDDIRMAKVDVSLMEIASIIGPDHVLRRWTRL